jgi:hypothetical protein
MGTSHLSANESNFRFISELPLREILEKIIVEIQKAFVSECWKSVIILAGGSIEAILLDRLSYDADRARAAKSAPSCELSKWDLSELIKVAVKMKIVELSAERAANAVRMYRNLIHPGVELRSKLSVDRLEAEGALNILKVVHRDLSKP